jgi:hypothetical protein
MKGFVVVLMVVLGETATEMVVKLLVVVGVVVGSYARSILQNEEPSYQKGHQY